MTSARKRYPSDLTDLQWHNVSHLFPGGDCPSGGPGRPRTYDLRELVNAVLYLARSGCTEQIFEAPREKHTQEYVRGEFS